MKPKTLDTFTLAYITCALWSSLDDEGNPLDSHYDIEDIMPETLARMVQDCESFQSKHMADIELDLSQAGHDFWLTRNCHGAGFWDGDWPKDVGERLTNASHTYGEIDLYVGDNGKI